MSRRVLSGFVSHRCSRTLYRLQRVSLTVLVLLLMLFCLSATAAVAVTDLTTHPVYAKYSFIRDGKHIYFGTQPSAAPEGVIGVVMSHDALLKRNLKKLGMEIIFYPFLNGPDSNFFMQQDKIDMTMAGDMPTIAIAATGKTRITGLAKLSNASIVTRDRYNHLSELRGKRIGVSEGTSAHLGLLTALAAADMTENAVQIVFMDISELTSALVENRIDAFSAWEPTAAGALAGHSDFVVIHRFLNSSYLYQTRKFAREHPQASLQLHAAFLRALRWLNANDENLLQAAAWTLLRAEKVFGYKPGLLSEQLALVTTEGILRFAESPRVPRSDFKPDGFLAKAFNFLKARSKLPADATWDTILQSLDNQILKTVLESPDEYQIDVYTPDKD